MLKKAPAKHLRAQEWCNGGNQARRWLQSFLSKLMTDGLSHSVSPMPTSNKHEGTNQARVSSNTTISHQWAFSCLKLIRTPLWRCNELAGDTGCSANCGLLRRTHLPYVWALLGASCLQKWGLCLLFPRIRCTVHTSILVADPD